MLNENEPSAAPEARVQDTPEQIAMRGQRLKSLMPLYSIGDARAESEIVALLAESLVRAGDKQPKRAEWLGLSARYLRHLLSAEVGISAKHPEVHGRVQGYRDRSKEPKKKRKRKPKKTA